MKRKENILSALNGLLVAASTTLILLQACSSSIHLPTDNNFETQDTLDMISPPSHLVAHLSIQKQAITDSVNTVLDSTLSNPIRLDQRGTTIFLQRLNHVSLDAQDKSVLITLPMLINVIQKTILGPVSATGQINMTFDSKIDIDSSWQLTTKTTLADYEWISTPKLTTRWANLPITWLSNAVLKRSRDQIAKSIDTSIHQNLDLTANAKVMASRMLLPYQLDSTVGGWLTPQCPEVILSPLINSEDYISTVLNLPMTIALTSEVNTDTIHELPRFVWGESDNDTSTINVGAYLSNDYLEHLSKEKLIGKTFRQDNRSITIKDIALTTAQDLIHIEITTTGSFNGQLSLAFSPRYEDGILHNDDIQWAIKTKNILHRTASWLAKGYIHDKIEEMLTIDIKPYIANAKEELYQQLNKLKTTQDIDVQIAWRDLYLKDIAVHNDGLRAHLTARLQLSVDINNLRLDHMLEN